MIEVPSKVLTVTKDQRKNIHFVWKIDFWFSELLSGSDITIEIKKKFKHNEKREEKFFLNKYNNNNITTQIVK